MYTSAHKLEHFFGRSCACFDGAHVKSRTFRAGVVEKINLCQAQSPNDDRHADTAFVVVFRLSVSRSESGGRLSKLFNHTLEAQTV